MAVLDELREIIERDWRRRHGLLAERAGLHRITISRFVNDRATLSVEAMERVAAAVGRRVALVPIGKGRGESQEPNAGTG